MSISTITTLSSTTTIEDRDTADEILFEIQRELEMDREDQFILQQMIEECEEEHDRRL
jgi:hypothetical protein